jgi:hypothetical protein
MPFCLSKTFIVVDVRRFATPREPLEAHADGSRKSGRGETVSKRFD